MTYPNTPGFFIAPILVSLSSRNKSTFCKETKYLTYFRFEKGYLAFLSMAKKQTLLFNTDDSLFKENHLTEIELWKLKSSLRGQFSISSIYRIPALQPSKHRFVNCDFWLLHL